MISSDLPLNSNFAIAQAAAGAWVDRDEAVANQHLALLGPGLVDHLQREIGSLWQTADPARQHEAAIGARCVGGRTHSMLASVGSPISTLPASSQLVCAIIMCWVAV